MPDIDMPSSPKRKFHLVILLMICVTGLLSMLLLAILAVSWSDITREVPAPEIAKLFESKPKQASTSTTLVAVLISDDPDHPDFVRDHRDEINAHLAEITHVFEVYRTQESSITTTQEAYRSYLRMRKDYVRANNAFYKTWLNAGGTGEPARRDFRKIMKQFDEQLSAELEEMNIRFENWNAAAANREAKGDWDGALYYWRKNGLYGRSRIVSGSIVRRLAADQVLAPVIKLLPYNGPEKLQYGMFQATKTTQPRL